MTTPRSHYITLCGREVHYVEWGTPGKPPLILWHGVARTGRDFDDLAIALADDRHIIVPDTIGRGLSQWTPDETEYATPFYARQATELVDKLGFDTVDWIGTSMGAIIGIRAASGALQGRIRRFVLNDMGPIVAQAALDRIRSYAGAPPRFERVSELETYLRQIYKPYGFISDEGWRRMTETSVRRLPDGAVTTHFDPRIKRHFDTNEEQWDNWDRLTCDMLCLRGETSDLLLPEDARKMSERNPRCRVVTIAGCGHAPALNVPEQIDLVVDFINTGI
ncbi:alpha/beta hydrolase [Bradyrhizobium sp. U87765 SZCCT0131]|uniref:alpha/beta fold hydrolase n=1 Tax=unclassified Bradyrhizobium TaxID=2631580 RepID=UPI001BA5AD9D|nr:MULTISPECIES: alpha/beta hydrolase [unclassified Bradyrhizobium]MBR1218227.1 alpha/beta hydrolase [Bradyrhizobium sp. U87765 SZCCT0131]MBR1260827.1 alpha/beta hydrolase [Bradyrhizobium sp. U87765 SZCCT0134]MBR1303725.1 alpha/beta hydrolase [Bradyrhizobium sp. U87765 SZCCT0110]MBR1319331.1 alpha/beta hydrolase [Bradyrhizobium sp. U87765 SZCCT0109]MBR1347656.1 alpha/beta hydrolase [Bradyrhizobium sp. U87765 SZCCT0048]